MSNELIKEILTSDKLIIPYELTDNKKQISFMVTVSSGNHSSFSFFDDCDEYPGLTSIIKQKIDSKEIEYYINRLPNIIEMASPSRIDITKSSIIIGTNIINIIKKIIIFNKKNQKLSMYNEGAIYPYGLVIDDIEY